MLVFQKKIAVVVSEAVSQVMARAAEPASEPNRLPLKSLVLFTGRSEIDVGNVEATDDGRCRPLMRTIA